MLGIYELNRIELLRDVFVWAYKRSCARYSAVRQSLGEPDPFRFFTSRHIQAPDRERFIEVVENQLLSLHEGNIARYRLRSSEFLSWRETWH